MSGVFDSLIGNDKLKALLADDFKKKTHNHAYIIEGPGGSGKKTLAYEMCKALMCTGSGERFPCGKCPSCKKISDGYCSDIYVLDRGDAASVSVEAVRKMTDTALFLPDDGNYKAYIIEDADKMTVQAQNAFLLSLEEPPEYVMYLLLCRDASKLLETVRSRAPVIKTEIFSNDFVAKWLRSQPVGKNASDKDIAAACAVSRGALGTALNCLSGSGDTDGIAAIADEAQKLVSTLCTSGYADRIIYCMGVKHTRAEFSMLFEYAMLCVRDFICVKSGGTETLYFADCGVALDICAKLSIRRLVSLYDALEAAEYDIAERNASASAVMGSLAAKDI